MNSSQVISVPVIDLYRKPPNRLLRPLHKYSGEVLAMPIEDNQPQDHYDDCRRYSSWIQERVIQNDVHNYWSKQHKTQGHEPIHQQQRTACDL